MLLVREVLLFVEMLAREEKGQIAGLTVLVDAAGFGWRQMRGVTLEGLLFCLNLLQVRQFTFII